MQSCIACSRVKSTNSHQRKTTITHYTEEELVCRFWRSIWTKFVKKEIIPGNSVIVPSSTLIRRVTLFLQTATKKEMCNLWTCNGFLDDIFQRRAEMIELSTFIIVYLKPDLKETNGQIM